MIGLIAALIAANIVFVLHGTNPPQAAQAFNQTYFNGTASRYVDAAFDFDANLV